jgi:plastocyanin
MVATPAPKVVSSPRVWSSLRSPRGRLAVVAVGATLSFGLVVGCSSGTPSGNGSAGAAGTSVAATSASGATSGSSTAQAAQPIIHISSYKYDVPTSVAPGAMVGVMNMDGENHTVTADSGKAFDVKAVAGQTVMFAAPMTPGTYAFHCTYHSNMHGVLVVK